MDYLSAAVLGLLRYFMVVRLAAHASNGLKSRIKLILLRKIRKKSIIFNTFEEKDFACNFIFILTKKISVTGGLRCLVYAIINCGNC